MSITYTWKYYIKPIIFLTSPNSPKGLELRIDKLKEDATRKGNKQ